MKIGIISGKGGTGKTTIAISIAELEKGSISIDADVDASNMFLYYDGRDVNREYFSGGEIAEVDLDICTRCGECNRVCKFDAIDNGLVNSLKCEGCGACQIVCPVNAIKMVEEKTADIYETITPIGKIFRADMEVGGEGSGLLVSQLRKKAEGQESESGITILDGSPGVGCSVIASITGNDLVLIVTEPTKSGKEDFIRAHELTRHFGIRAVACINKYDINKDMADEIENYCKRNEIDLVGKIPFDEKIVESINNLRPIVYYKDSKANLAIRNMWTTIRKEYINRRG